MLPKPFYLSFLVSFVWLVMIPVALADDAVRVYTKSSVHTFSTELADTPAERAKGLMFRKSMLQDDSMLFDFQIEKPLSFWMKNTYIPLDMIFIGSDGLVVSIKTDAVPLSEAYIPSGKPARYVLEVVAGTVGRIGLVVGDRIEHPVIKP